MFDKRQFADVSLVWTLLCLSGTAIAQDEARDQGPWRIGIGSIVLDQPYAGADVEVRGFPVVGYIGERLRVLGPRATYRLFGNEAFSLSADANVRFSGYEPEDSAALLGMEERDMSLDGGLSAATSGVWGTLELGMLTDLLDRHSGQEARLSYAYELSGKRLTVTPFAGVRWMSEELSDYYYGVRPQEATSTRPAYEVSSTISVFAGATARYPLSSRWSALGVLAFQSLDDELRASPIVEDDTSSMLLVTLTRSF